jgi:hypothetical protein
MCIRDRVGVGGGVELYKKLGEYGVGRNITAFFVRQSM